MTDLSAEEVLAGEYLRAVCAQGGGMPDGVAPAAHLQRALGWEDAPFQQIGRLLHGAGLVRLLVGGVRLTAEGRVTAEEYEPASYRGIGAVVTPRSGLAAGQVAGSISLRSRAHILARRARFPDEPAGPIRGRGGAR